MAISDILLLGEKRLYDKSEPVLREELSDFIPQINLMFDTIADFRNKYGSGRAIAAPQIGLFKRIICLNIDKPVALINPVINSFSDEMIELWDDCMSFPNLLVKVKRHKSVSVKFLDLQWEEQIWELTDDLSELIQHEYDHLDGILAIQRAIDNKTFKWKK
ncbi:MAG: peptide deformylase [Prolixibacteraceae bacterium]|nr:peptide deformylase [Prolixibacteraceae bacterium]MBN2773670.1 peptide deformylase [Prolixibacteraceae bacterium]